MKNTEIVLSVIKKSSKKLTAYAILEKFQKIKKVQPMTVYRALNDLIEQGVIHKSNQKKPTCYAITLTTRNIIQQLLYVKNAVIQRN